MHEDMFLFIYFEQTVMSQIDRVLLLGCNFGVQFLIIKIRNIAVLRCTNSEYTLSEKDAIGY